MFCAPTEISVALAAPAAAVRAAAAIDARRRCFMTVSIRKRADAGVARTRSGGSTRLSCCPSARGQADVGAIPQEIAEELHDERDEKDR